MSGSSSDTAAALSKAFSQLELSQASLAELQQALIAYVERHNKGDEGAQAKIQDELRKIYKVHLEASPSKLGPFMTTLKTLRPSLSHGDIVEWFASAVRSFLDQPFSKKNYVQDAQDFVVESILYDQEAPDASQRAEVSMGMTKKVVEEYLRRTIALSAADGAPSLRIQNQAQQRLQAILIACGRKQPKDLFTVLDRFFIQRDTRYHILQLLSAWLQQQQPHLDLVVQTPLVEHILQCLMNDRSTLLVSVALQCLVMLLPHIPHTVSSQLPRLFLIYSRCLCWEKFSASSSQAQKDLVTDDRLRRGSDSESEPLYSIDPTWKVITSVPGVSESSAPELLSYFTYLYGLYPLNLMAYIRKPRKYLKNIEFDGADNFDLDQTVIRNRTEQFQRAHLLHPNFFNTTVEDELADNRWLKAEPAEVVTACLALYAGSQQLPTPGPPPSSKLPPLPTPQSPQSESPSRSKRSSSISEAAGATDERNDVDHSRTNVSGDAGFLQRELLLLRNELNFERYLKQQHSAAIGQLKRENIKAVTMEAETATLINANRSLQKKLNDATKMNEKLQKETQARKVHTKQSEDQLTAKMRTLRSGLADQELLATNLKKANSDIEQLRQLLVESESKELQAREELEDKEKEIDTLKARIATLEEQMQDSREVQKQSGEALLENDKLRHDLEQARAQVVSRDQERERSRKVFQAKIADLEARLALAEVGEEGQPADVTELHNRLADAQTKQLSMKRAWTKANAELQDLKLRYEELLGSSETGQTGLDGAAPPTRPLALPYNYAHNEGFSNGQTNLWQGPAVGQTYQQSEMHGMQRAYSPSSQSVGMNGQSFPPNRPMRAEAFDQRQQSYSPLSRSEGTPAHPSPYIQPGWERSMASGASDAGSYPGGVPIAREGSQSAFSLASDDTSLRSDGKPKVKIQPESKVRVYGRGGAQNIKMKSKDDEGKEEKPKSGLAAGLKNLF
ncbi:hypothetical protein MBLNU457_1198t1 [Dothideomycetes sp. NU457]